MRSRSSATAAARLSMVRRSAATRASSSTGSRSRGLRRSCWPPSERTSSSRPDRAAARGRRRLSCRQARSSRFRSLRSSGRITSATRRTAASRRRRSCSPANTLVEFHVTSLDAIHSFWAYQLGVKADANPGVDNVAFVKTNGPRSFQVRCAQLCGLWHGYMFDSGRFVSGSQFASWVKGQRAAFAPVAKYLPKYSNTYLPDPQRRAGRASPAVSLASTC